MDFVYLAGAIDCNPGNQKSDWQLYTIKKLANHGIMGISPLITEQFIRSTQGQGKTAITINESLIQMCQACLFYFSDVFSVGTPQELYYAYRLNIPLRVVVKPDHIKSLYMEEQATHIVDSLDDAIDIIINQIGANVQSSEWVDPFRLVKITRTEAAKKYPMPCRAYGDDACYDLYVSEDITLEPRVFTNVSTGISMEIPSGWWVELRARSSTTRRLNILVADAVIDEGYRGELYIQAIPMDNKPKRIEAGSRIAQFRFSRRRDFHFTEVDELALSLRGANGFGSSGK